MPPRFFAPDAAAPGEVVQLPADEAQHLVRVLRLGAGAAVRVFNGRGREFDAVVERAGRHAASVRIGPDRQPAPEPRVAVTLAQAVLKGDKMDDVVRDAVMMGVAAVRPVIAERSETARTATARASRHARWTRVAISSAKQCGRAVVPDVHEPAALEEILAGLEAGSLPPALMLVEPGTAAGVLRASNLEGGPPAAATVLIGPEGGWAPHELEAASRCCRLVRLGGRTLRADAMALVGLAALYARWGEF